MVLVREGLKMLELPSPMTTSALEARPIDRGLGVKPHADRRSSFQALGGVVSGVGTCKPKSDLRSQH
uniref:Uncharacterized protein n=1 Tax=Setaria viridis TaxID=4556 RepID=A0A4U6V330_SETVI|nr:hypothetical protein SEVIR_4G142200v2 [Setaria viridis]